MTGDALIQLLGAIGGASVVTAVVNAIVNRRKMGADVTKVIQEAAGGAVALVQADNTRLREELATLKSEHAAEFLALKLETTQEARRLKTEHTVEVESLRGANEDLWRKAREQEQENAVLTDVIRDQADYTRRAASEIRRLGGNIEDPPELPMALLG